MIISLHENANAKPATFLDTTLSMSHIPFIRPLQPWRRIDQYAMSVRPLRRTDVYPKLLELYLDPDDPCPGIDESQTSFSSKGGVTDYAETDTSLSTYQNHKDSDAYIETVKDQPATYHGSTESNNLSLKHNAQETSFESGQYSYLWCPQDWLMPPSWYCKYMERYMYMPLEVDSATSLSSPESSYGEVNGVDPHLLEIVEQIEYYLSFDNLIYDAKFQDYMNYSGGWVPLALVASLPKVRELTLNVEVIEEALETLSFLIEIKDGTKLIRHRDSWQRWKPYAVMN